MTEEHIDTQPRWTVSKKLLTFFILSYVFFYIFPFPLDEIPFVKDIVLYYSKTIEFITLWIGRHLIGLKSLEKIAETGSGDTTFDYVKLITTSLLSTVSSVVLFILTRKQKNYSKLVNYLILYTRYYVGLYMVIYGLAKLYGGQFIFPDFTQLEKTYGSSSPMNLLWTFMGYSKSYTVFSGTGEIVGGLLLFFRRTTVLGCIVTITVMLNVVMLNFSYDVPVKLFSCHLVLISLFIASPFIKKLIDFFIFHKTTELSFEKINYKRKWMRVTRIVLKVLIIIGIPVFGIVEEMKALEKYERKGAFDGMYKTETFVCNKTSLFPFVSVKKDTLPPLITDAFRWDNLIIEHDYIIVTSMSNISAYYQFTIDTIKHKITLSNYNDSSKKYILDYKIQPDNLMSFSGFYVKDTIYAVLRKKTLEEYPLVNRGFHWINEYPFNR